MILYQTLKKERQKGVSRKRKEKRILAPGQKIRLLPGQVITSLF